MARGNSDDVADFTMRVASSKSTKELLEAIRVEDFTLVLSDEVMFRGVMLHALVLFLAEYNKEE